MKNRMNCPCKSGKQYEVCCKPFHMGKNPDTALQLMRSRFAAYALSLSQYIMDTTHRANPQFDNNSIKWAKHISEFSSQTEFVGLDILDSKEKGSTATVTFVAHLIQDEKDASFTEKSTFEKVNGRWLYVKGDCLRSSLYNS
jgi:SEC-C motif-containing protein